MGDKHGLAVPLVGPNVEIEPVGSIERLWLDLAVPVADCDRHVFGTLIKGAQGLS